MKSVFASLALTNLPRNEHGSWTTVLLLQRSVPMGVGARYEHPRMADGENMYLVAEDLPACAERRRENLVDGGVMKYGLFHEWTSTGRRRGWEASAERGRLVVMAFAGEDFNGVVDDAKDDAISLVDTDTPPAAEVVAQGFGVADASRAVAVNALEKLVDAPERFGVLMLPGKVFLPGVVVPDLTHGRDPRRQSGRVRLCCGRRPCRGRDVQARGCWTRCRKDRQELQRAVCRAERIAERKP